jgi:hypothetical protein
MPLPEEIITRCEELMQAHAGELNPEIYTRERLQELEDWLIKELRSPSKPLPPNPKTVAQGELLDNVQALRDQREVAAALVDEGTISRDELAVIAPQLMPAIDQTTEIGTL